MNKRIIAILLLALLVAVSSGSLSYYVASQLTQTPNNPSPTPTPESTPPPTSSPTPTPSMTPTPSPSEEPASTSKSSVPEFTVEFVDYSYDVPPTYGIDQYTGDAVITKHGYRVENRTVVFTIKNKPFTSYEEGSGNIIEVYYNFRFKGAYGSEWSYYPFKPDGYSAIPYGMLTGNLSPKLSQSNTDYTVTSIDLDILLAISSGYTGYHTYPTGGEIEFQAQAIVGSIDYEASGLIAGSYYTFTGETSGWSETQTITLP